MKNPFKFQGTSEYDGCITSNYIYKNLSVVVSKSDEDYDNNCKLPEGKTNLHISVAKMSGFDIQEQDLARCFAHFGLDQNLPVQCFESESTRGGVYKKILHLYQIQDKKPCLLS